MTSKRFPEAKTRWQRIVKFTRYYIAYALVTIAFHIDYDGEFNAAFVRDGERSRSEW